MIDGGKRQEKYMKENRSDESYFIVTFHDLSLAKGRPIARANDMTHFGKPFQGSKTTNCHDTPTAAPPGLCQVGNSMTKC